MNKSFISYELKHGLIADLTNDYFPTLVYGFCSKEDYDDDDDDDRFITLPAGGTHFGFVFKGEAELYRFDILPALNCFTYQRQECPHHKTSKAMFLVLG